MAKKMVYEVRVTEKSKAVIPVLAESSEEAQKIFDEWHDEHEDDLYDMLENGYEGYEIKVGSPRDLNTYPLDDILLPLELQKKDEAYSKKQAVILWDELLDTVSVTYHSTYGDVMKYLGKIAETYDLAPFLNYNWENKQIEREFDKAREISKDKYGSAIWVLKKRLRGSKTVKPVKQERSYISYELDCDKSRVARPED